MRIEPFSRPSFVRDSLFRTAPFPGGRLELKRGLAPDARQGFRSTGTQIVRGGVALGWEHAPWPSRRLFGPDG